MKSKRGGVALIFAGHMEASESSGVDWYEELGAEWKSQAACDARKGIDPDIFFKMPHGRPGSQGYCEPEIQAAKAICATCPVKAECLETAMRTHERFGIWGGLTYAERRKLFADRQHEAQSPVRNEADFFKCGHSRTGWNALSNGDGAIRCRTCKYRRNKEDREQNRMLEPGERGGISAAEVARVTGASYRQIDYWCSQGWLSPVYATGHEGQGGLARRFPEEEVAKVAALLEASRLSRSIPELAERLKSTGAA